jgi:hypothetical protein
MFRFGRRRTLAGAIAVLLLAGGAAAAAVLLTRGHSRSSASATPRAQTAQPSQKGDRGQQKLDPFFNDVAHRLGVQPGAVQRALESVALQRLQQAVAKGALTADQAKKYRWRIRHGHWGVIGKLQKLATVGRANPSPSAKHKKTSGA